MLSGQQKIRQEFARNNGNEVRLGPLITQKALHTASKEGDIKEIKRLLEYIHPPELQTLTTTNVSTASITTSSQAVVISTASEEAKAWMEKDKG